MKTPSNATDRTVRIELLKARAALERQSIARNVRILSHDIHPASIMRNLFPRLASRSPAGWLMQGLSATRRYPLVTSSLSALLSGATKRKRWLRIGAGLLLTWQVARSLNKNEPRRLNEPRALNEPRRVG
jgi:hypothetical protein